MNKTYNDVRVCAQVSISDVDGKTYVNYLIKERI